MQMKQIFANSVDIFGVKLPETVLALLLITIVALSAYANSYDCAFHFDDLPHLVESPHLHDLSRVKDWLSHYPTRPFGFFTFAVNYHFHQLDLWGYHAVNVGIHLLTAWLVYLLAGLLLTTFGSPPLQPMSSFFIRLLAGLIFVAHPVQTQAVTYIIQRLASLAAFFYVASFVCYLLGRKSASKAGWFLLAFISGLLGLLTKETLATLPLVILLYELQQNPNWRAVLLSRKAAIIAGCLSLPVILVLSLYPLTLFKTIPPVQGNTYSITTLTYFLTQFKVIWTYIRLACFPINQNIDYDYPLSTGFFEGPTFLAFLGLILLIVTAGRLFQRHKTQSFCIFWFLITLAVESSIIALPNVIFEHRLYLPMAGFAILVAYSLYVMLARFHNTRLYAAVGATLIIILSAATYQRNQVWKTDLTLWADAAEKSPKKARPLTNLGLALEESGDFQRAEQLYRQALAINPNYDIALNNLGKTLHQQGQLDSARVYYERALAVKPKFINALYNLGTLWQATGHLDQAESLYKQILALNPNEAGTLNNLGNLWREKGDPGQAIGFYRRAIVATSEIALLNLGDTFFQQNELDSAFTYYGVYLDRNPGFAGPLFMLADEWQKRDDKQKALNCLQRILIANPQHPQALEKKRMLITGNAQ